MKTWIVTAPCAAGRGDGIADYAHALADTLAGDGTHVRVVVAGRDPLPGHAEVAGVLHQYSPHASTPALQRWTLALGRAHVPVVLTIHEYWPPANGTLRRYVLRTRLRWRLERLAAAAAALVVSNEWAANELVETGVLPHAPTLIPIGSAIPRVPSTGPRDGGLVIFGQPASFEDGYVAAVERWRRTVSPMPALTWVSRSTEELTRVWTGIASDTTGVRLAGFLSADAVSEVLSRATLAIAPYSGGASGRRSTLAALLQHGVPCVALDGRAADSWARGTDGLVTMAPDSPEGFVARVDRLWHDAAAREHLSAAAVRLHDAHLTWDTIGAAYRALMHRAQERTA